MDERATMSNDLLNKLSDEDFFKAFVTQCVSNSLVLAIDSAVTDKPLSYTQKQAIANYRDSGLLNSIIMGDFERVSIMKIIEILSVFNLALTIHAVDKDSLSKQRDVLTKH